uniref:V-type proton ATPase subunit E n=1 Tax=Rhizophora mucronata TaxID=61149 RepID=A0A2P2KXF6_RHIMU
MFLPRIIYVPYSKIENLLFNCLAGFVSSLFSFAENFSCLDSESVSWFISPGFEAWQVNFFFQIKIINNDGR